jgi:methyltransferase (TIGR00027 family)
MTDRRPPDHPGDTWDITTSLGATALGVAAYRAAETVQPNPLIHDEVASVLVGAVGTPGWQRLARADMSWLDDDDDRGRRVMVSSREFVGAQTLFFDRFCAEAVTSGVLQVVIMAAGLDARSYRLTCLRECAVYEIDQPEVLKFKLMTLAARHVSPVAILEPVGVDLREDWGAALIERGFQSWAPAAWLVEGLLPYVPSATQRRLVSDVTALSAPGSRLAAEAYPSATTHLGPERMAAWRESTGKIRERLGVGVDVTTLTQQDEPTDVDALLAEHGWTVTTVDSCDEMARLGRPVPDDLADAIPVAALISAELREHHEKQQQRGRNNNVEEEDKS